MKQRIVLVMLVVVGLALTLATAVSAQGPKPGVRATVGSLGRGLTYQGQLKQTGTAVNATCSFGFTLWDSPSGGTQIGTVQTQSLAVANGLFTSNLIDFGANAFLGDARYLQIAVQCPGDTSATTLSRQNLTATPYALYAPSAGYAWDGPFWLRGGNAGTNPSLDFLGTSDNVTLTLRTASAVGWRLAPAGANAPNIVGGSAANWVTSGVSGAVIGGGGSTNQGNRVTDNNGTIGGGVNNQAGDNAGNAFDKPLATVGGGGNNTASGPQSTIGGGAQNNASGDQSAIGGGFLNTASNTATTIGGGVSNTASASNATVAGGNSNTASSPSATVSGGVMNTASGSYATVAGGRGNSAAGNYSFAAGYRAISGEGAFVFADSNAFDFSSTASNQFRVRSTGGAQFVTAIDGSGNPTAGVQVASGGGSWSSLSDRAAKSNLAAVNGKDILARLASVPIESWNYNSQDASIRHIGPMAQDFYEAFQLGEDDRHISTVDADGVALAAIQGLNQVVQEKDAEVRKLKSQVSNLESENSEMRSQNAKQQTQLDGLQIRIAALEERASASPMSPVPHTQFALLAGVVGTAVALGWWRRGGGR